jgi:methionyl-tRNA synthetase
VNDVPHIGHAYTTIVADIIARWHRLNGDDVFFLTGLDENSIKTVQAAESKKISNIQEYVDEMAGKFKAAWKALDIQNDDFIRTTEERHRKNVIEVINKVNAKGDIYKGKYEGLYCEGCEGFLLEKDLADGKCPITKLPQNICQRRIISSSFQNTGTKY